MNAHIGSAVLATLFAASTALASSPFISNSVKYKDSGVKNATGRAGDAVVEARALLGKDETTSIEVSANGTIEKVQVKIPDQSAQNFNGVDSETFSRSITGLLHGHPLQLQVNVSSAEASRTGVVTVSDQVRYRPDLRVTSVLPPQTGVIGVPVSISATLQETNGDTGARANCVLLADGVQVDHADGIWVDAGGVVSCRFSAIFDTPGTKQLQVIASGVTPADYDDANNSATASVLIYESIEGFTKWNATVRETNYLYRRTFDSDTLKTLNEESGLLQSVRLDAFLPARLPDLGSLKVSYQELSDGQVILDLPNVHWDFISTPTDWLYCASSIEGPYGYDSAGIEVCNLPYWVGAPYFQLTTGRTAGDVTYRSSIWSRYFWNGEEQIYSVNTQFTEPYGVPHPFGNTHELRVTMTDGNTLWHVEPQITEFEEFSYDESSPKQCGFDPYQYGAYCSRMIDRGTGRVGRAGAE